MPKKSARKKLTNAVATAKATTAARAIREAQARMLRGPSRYRSEKMALELRDVVARERAQRYADYVQEVRQPTAKPRAAVRSDLETAPPKQLRILAEGDSWFDYPLPFRPFTKDGDGVIYQLEKLLGYSILNMAHHGDDVQQMLSLTQRAEIVSSLSDPNIRFDAMLFSGGGNDLIGDQFVLWLKEVPAGSPPEDLLDDDALKAIFGVVRTGYLDLLGIRDRYSPDTIVFLHGYDFPPINGKGVCGAGPWLKPSLDYQYRLIGVPNPDPHDEYLVVREFLSRFNAMLKAIADEPKNRAVLVGTQGTLEPIDADWQNEIHPSPSGFKKIAAVYQRALEKAFP